MDFRTFRCLGWALKGKIKPGIPHVDPCRIKEMKFPGQTLSQWWPDPGEGRLITFPQTYLMYSQPEVGDVGIWVSSTTHPAYPLFRKLFNVIEELGGLSFREDCNDSFEDVKSLHCESTRIVR